MQQRWDLSGFEIENCPYRLRVVKYHEMWLENGKEAERWMWQVTTLEQTAPEILWEMMNRRWDIEENLMIIGFNIPFIFFVEGEQTGPKSWSGKMMDISCFIKG